MILTRLHLVLLVVATLLLCLVRLTDQSGMRHGNAFCEICLDILFHGQVNFLMYRYYCNGAWDQHIQCKGRQLRFRKRRQLDAPIHNIFLLCPSFSVMILLNRISEILGKIRIIFENVHNDLAFTVQIPLQISRGNASQINTYLRRQISTCLVSRRAPQSQLHSLCDGLHMCSTRKVPCLPCLPSSSN